jgi:hypothetical protein
MAPIVDLIDRVIQAPEDQATLKAVASDAYDLMAHRPLFVTH